MAEHRGERRQRHAGRDCGNPEAVPQALGAGLGATDSGLVHQGANLSKGTGAGHWPDPAVAARGLRLAGAQAVREFQAAGQFNGHRHFAPALGAALEGADAQQRLFEVDIGGPQREGFGDPAAAEGQGQGKGLHFGARRAPRRGDEPVAFFGA